MLAAFLDFLPPDLEPASIRDLALLDRAFDRPSGQLLFVLRHDGARAILSRPSHFELFRAIPVRGHSPFAIMTSESVATLEVNVVDGRVLRLALDAEEAQRLEPFVRHETARVEIVPGRGDRGTERPRRSSIRPPESVEAEVVVVPEHVLRKPITPAPAPIRGQGAVEDLARKIVVVDSAPTPLPRARPSSPPAPRPSPRPPRPPQREGDAIADDRSSTIPPALAPSPAALARVRGERVPDSGEHESVRPPAFTPQPMRAVTSPRDTSALRVRLQRHWERGELDEASQVARVLSFLGSGDPTERRLASLAGDGAPSLGSALSRHLFSAYVAHDDEDPDLARLCAALWPALLTMRLRPERDLGLRPRDLVDVATAESGFAAAFRRAARSLSLSLPRLWIRTDVSGGLAYLNVSPMGSLCGGSLASSFSADEMLFVAAHHLAFYRPEVYLFALLPNTTDLLTLACAGLLLERRMAPEPRLVKVAEAIERFMVPQVRDSLRHACSELSLVGGDPRTQLAAELARFRRAAHVSAVRAGFALTGSIHLAARMARLLPAQAGLDVEEVVDDLASYAVSPGWLSLRRELGIALAPSSPEILV
ncbi:MAG: hypothetical protein J0L92_10415 [Deltaproteobacteria bacterium]|nr:hypothetical protein [Deltaproteobacteria bacterium]